MYRTKTFITVESKTIYKIYKYIIKIPVEMNFDLRS